MPFLIRLPLPDGAVVLKAAAMCGPARRRSTATRRSVGRRSPTSSIGRRCGLPAAGRGGRSGARPGPGAPFPVRVHPRPAAGEVIFWQSPRTRRQARPDVSLAHGPGAGISSWRSWWTATSATRGRSPTSKRRTRPWALPAGDYAVPRCELDGRIVAAVERKSLADLVSTLDQRELRYLLAELATAPAGGGGGRGPLLGGVQARHVRPATVADGLGEAAARFPAVIPIVFCRDPAAGRGVDLPFSRRGRRAPPRGPRRRGARGRPPTGRRRAGPGADHRGGPGVGPAARAGGPGPGPAPPGGLGCLPQRRRRGRDRPCRHRAALNGRTITRPGRGAPVASVLVSGSHPGGADR